MRERDLSEFEKLLIEQIIDLNCSLVQIQSGVQVLCRMHPEIKWDDEAMEEARSRHEEMLRKRIFR